MKKSLTRENQRKMNIEPILLYASQKSCWALCIVNTFRQWQFHFPWCSSGPIKNFDDNRCCFRVRPGAYHDFFKTNKRFRVRPFVDLSWDLKRDYESSIIIFDIGLSMRGPNRIFCLQTNQSEHWAFVN